MIRLKRIQEEDNGALVDMNRLLGQACLQLLEARRSPDTLFDRDRLQIEVEGLSPLALDVIDHTDVIERCSFHWPVSQFTGNRQRLTIGLQRLLMSAQLAVDKSYGITSRSLAFAKAYLLHDRQCFAQEVQGFGIVAQLSVYRPNSLQSCRFTSAITNLPLDHQGLLIGF